ncbi:MAG: thermonuclease family protein [Rhizobiaceae bacterium]|nr:thermonuclease family protein [Rhizobiaceae bacterium]
MAGTLIWSVIACISLVAIDGDSISCDGVAMQDVGPGEPNVSGYAAPDLVLPACAREELWGSQAKVILQDLLDAPGTVVEDSGERDRYGLPLVRVKLADGRTAGEELIRLRYAVAWKPGETFAWCNAL